jgi:hypothetical protein
MRVCIGIVCIGKKYLEDFNKTFKPSVDTYAQKHGYDVRVFDSFLDTGHTHPDCISFQKCLVPRELKQYDCVIVLDADIWIHDYALPIHTLLGDKIGIVNEVAQLTQEQYKALGFASQPTEYYQLAGFDLQTDTILNTGLILCNPRKHADLLENIYNKYIGNMPHPRRFHYEQACIGYELQTQGMYSLLDNRWNYLYIFNHLLRLPFHTPYFTHFASCGSKYLESYLTTHGLKRRFAWGIHK